MCDFENNFENNKTHESTALFSETPHYSIPAMYPRDHIRRNVHEILSAQIEHTNFIQICPATGEKSQARGYVSRRGDHVKRSMTFTYVSGWQSISVSTKHYET